MFERGVVEEVRAALAAGPISRTAASAVGLHDIGNLSRDGARAAILRRTLRYAAYQRKWMRRIPGLVMIDAERPPAEVADEILEVVESISR
jgi:tRNA A37 N6-isopentenylltransferase MiaA